MKYTANVKYISRQIGTFRKALNQIHPNLLKSIPCQISYTPNIISLQYTNVSTRTIIHQQLHDSNYMYLGNDMARELHLLVTTVQTFLKLYFELIDFYLSSRNSENPLMVHS